MDIVAGKVSLIENNEDQGEVTGEIEYSTIDELAAIAASYAWAPGLFSDGRRLIKNLCSIKLLVLDVDGGCKLDEAKAAFSGYKHIICTSRNHQRDKGGVTCDRFRVVLFLESEITDDATYKATWETAKNRWAFIDPQCKDSSRYFYASPTVVSINPGIPYYVSSPRRDPQGSTAVPVPNVPSDPGARGELWKSTIDLLLNGASPGTRHGRLVSAVANMKEQGYPLPEIVEKLEDMALARDWTQPGLSGKDMRTIHRVHQRETKYPFKAKENKENEFGVIVNASDLLDETFAYLSDKDKVKGESTGIDGLDVLLGGGFRTGELTVLMAQAKTGKNTLYHYLIYKHLERGLPFGYASRELNPATEVLPNLLSIALKRNTWTSQIDSNLMSHSKTILSTWDLYFAPGYGHFDPDAIEAWMRALKDIGVDHFLFDHFHYALHGEDYESTAKLIKRLKSITKTLDIHLSLIVQPRSLREGESLSLATLRGGAAIGQALDNLLILERVRGEQNISRLKLEQARHKLARLGEIFLSYDSDTTSFQEVERSMIVEAPMPQGISRPWPRVN